MGYPDPRTKRPETPKARVGLPKTKWGTPDFEAIYNEVLDGKAEALKLNGEINEKLEEVQNALVEILKRLPREPVHGDAPNP